MANWSPLSISVHFLYATRPGATEFALSRTPFEIEISSGNYAIAATHNAFLYDWLRPFRVVLRMLRPVFFFQITENIPTLIIVLVVD